MDPTFWSLCLCWNLLQRQWYVSRIKYRLRSSSAAGISNVILFITTRHSFIKQVAKERGTRIRVTTQRITIRDDSGTDCVELDDIKTDSPSLSPTMAKSPYCTSFEDTGSFMGGLKEKVSFVSQHKNNDTTE